MFNLHYDALLTPDQLVLLRRWLAATGELYVRLEFPHGGGGGRTYLMRRLAELRRLLADQTHPELELFVYRDQQFPLRGTANDTMLQRAMELVPEGSWYSVVSLESYYPAALDYLAGGSSHLELQSEFAPLFGRLVAVGIDPCDVDDLSQVYSRRDVLFVSIRRNGCYNASAAGASEREAAQRDWNEGRTD